MHVFDDVIPAMRGAAWMGARRGIERHKRIRHFNMWLVELNRYANSPGLQSRNDARAIWRILNGQGLCKSEATQMREFALETMCHVNSSSGLSSLPQRDAPQCRSQMHDTGSP
jgi:hypothetical protein